MLSYSATQMMAAPDRLRLLDEVESFINEHFDGRITRILVATLTTGRLFLSQRVGTNRPPAEGARIGIDRLGVNGQGPRRLATVEPEGAQPKIPSARAGTLVASVVLAMLAVVGLVFAVYEYGNLHAARAATGIARQAC
jgi:hypothetical protein